MEAREARIHEAGGEMQLREGRNGTGQVIIAVTYDRYATGGNRDQQIDAAARLLFEYARSHQITIIGDDEFDYPTETLTQA